VHHVTHPFYYTSHTFHHTFQIFHVWHDTHIPSHISRISYVTWLTHSITHSKYSMCDMTHTFHHTFHTFLAWHDSSTSNDSWVDTWNMCDMTHTFRSFRTFHVCNDSHIQHILGVTWLTHSITHCTPFMRDIFHHTLHSFFAWGCIILIHSPIWMTHRFESHTCSNTLPCLSTLPCFNTPPYSN